MRVSLRSQNAESMRLCLVSKSGLETDRIDMSRGMGGTFSCDLEGVPDGQLYGLRVEGPWLPSQGQFFNSNKILLDPRAKEMVGNVSSEPFWSSASFDVPGERDERDSLAHVPLSRFRATRPQRPILISKSRVAHPLVYEVHVKGATIRHERIDPAVRGTYLGLCSDPFLEHLLSLGVQAVELLPVFAFADEPSLQQRGKRNFWGYNPLSFFALSPRYGADTNVFGSLADQFTTMVSTLHGAGIEVILDVVYNHSAEGGIDGPTTSFRGIDNSSYYLLDETHKGNYVDLAGTGNTIATSHPFSIELIMDSLRYWITEMGVDGFRFDLGSALSTTSVAGWHQRCLPAESPLYLAILQDPCISASRLIVEPWDATYEGMALGGFPHPIAEWNLDFRDTVRRYWKGEEGVTGRFASCLAGSEGIFSRSSRGAGSSVNFITAHDGFTLYDLVSYDSKQNWDNGEDNRDGSSHEITLRMGEEGPTVDEETLELRARTCMAMLASLILSLGTPMLLYGDEMKRSQNGNNNAYCQDNYLTWLDFSGDEGDFVEFVGNLMALRRDSKMFEVEGFLKPRRTEGNKAFDPLVDDAEWFHANGHPFKDEDWRDSDPQPLCLLRGRRREGTDGLAVMAVLFNPTGADASFQLPKSIGITKWRRIVSNFDSRSHGLDVTGEALVNLPSKGVAVLGA